MPGHALKSLCSRHLSIPSLPSLKSWFYTFHLSRSNPSYHVIFFMIFPPDLSPDVNSPFLEIVQHRNVCPYHLLSGNMIVTTQVMRPHLHIYQENSSVTSQLRLSEFLPENKTHEPCRKNAAATAGGDDDDGKKFRALFSSFLRVFCVCALPVVWFLVSPLLHDAVLHFKHTFQLQPELV